MKERPAGDAAPCFIQDALALQELAGSPGNKRNHSARALFLFRNPILEIKMKFITIAAVAALATIPALTASADPLTREQARADYHDAKSDAVKAQMQKEEAQASAESNQADAADAQAQANVAQSNAAQLQAQASAAQSQADAAQSQATASNNQANADQERAQQAKAERNAAIDRAEDARETARNN